MTNELMLKNRIMTYLSAGVVALSLIVYVLHRFFHLFEDYLVSNGLSTTNEGALELVLLSIPVFTIAVALLFLIKGIYNEYLPLLNTVTLTFASISLIASGNGMVEYHFSIFMVIAMIAYYESIKMILVSTVVFAIQHLVGYFTVPEIICGTDEYPFGVLMVHAIFLIFTSGATILQISMKKKYIQQVEADRVEKKAQFRHVLSNLQKTSDKIMDTTSHLVSNIFKTSSSSKEIASAIQQIASGSDLQSNSTKESSTAMNEMAVGIQRIAESSGIVSQRSQETVDEAKNGAESIRKTRKQMEFVDVSVKDLALTIDKMAMKSNEIDGIVQVITQITEQTNLLALNASIEAARAGEHGRGFAVVAEEVRKLAEQSKGSAADITRIVEEIQQATSTAKHSIDKGITEVNEGLVNVIQTDLVLNSIVQFAEEVAAQIEEVSAVAEQMSASSEEISASIDEMAFIAETSNGNTMSVLKLTDEQIFAIEEVEKVSGILQDISEDLNRLVSEFEQE
ncbi:methyl-accepting chemotaxis protein [Mesobacillus boroniphilus]|uniref:methyl-accepting chemotaxis protein n=1 Tax=Mesobacillus boroniphilus TaxID=308892 RepID=UPI001BD025CF